MRQKMDFTLTSYRYFYKANAMPTYRNIFRSQKINNLFKFRKRQKTKTATIVIVTVNKWRTSTNLMR